MSSDPAVPPIDVGAGLPRAIGGGPEEELEDSDSNDVDDVLLTPDLAQEKPDDAPAELWDLARRYAPCFVILPER